MNGFWMPFVAMVRRFFKAWTHALVMSVPERLRNYVLLTKSPIDILASDLELDSQGKLLLGNSIAVVIDRPSRLHYRFNIPKCAGAELSRAVALEAERVLPLQSGKLTCAFQASPQDASSDYLQVDIVAVKKRLIADIFKKAKSNNSLIKSISVVADDPDHLIEFSLRSVKIGHYSSYAVTIALVCSMFILAAQIPALYASRIEEEVAAIDQKILETRTATRQVAVLQSQMREKRGLSEAIADVTRNNRLTHLLEKLAAVSPDDVVLESLRVEGNRLHISGTAVDPEDWAIQINNVPAFEEIGLMSVRNIDASDSQRFELRLDVVWESLWELGT